MEIHYRNGEKEDLSVADEHQPMYYEAKEFIELIKDGQNQSKINSLPNSLIVMDILDEARKQMGIEFPADHSPVTKL